MVTVSKLVKQHLAEILKPYYSNTGTRLPALDRHVASYFR